MGKQWETMGTIGCKHRTLLQEILLAKSLQDYTCVIYNYTHMYIYRYICICIPYISIQLIVLEPYNYTCTLQYYIVIHILVIHSRTRNTQMFSRIMDPEVSSPFPKLEPNMLEPQTCCLWSVSSGCLAWQALHFVTL